MMSEDRDRLDDVYDLPHARNDNPSTSHESAFRLTSAKSDCLAMLLQFANHPRGLIDEAAGHLAGLHLDAHHKRGPDLRSLGLIEWLRDDSGRIMRAVTKRGRAAGISRITDAGREYLEQQAKVDAEADTRRAKAQRAKQNRRAQS